MPTTVIQRNDEIYVNQTTCIPYALKQKARLLKINFSQTLTEALRREIAAREKKC
jgi:post-segregation antitoxin (ccd killing protein)